MFGSVFQKKKKKAAERPASTQQTNHLYEQLCRTVLHLVRASPKLGVPATSIHIGLTYGAGYGEADEAAHKNAVVELIEEVAATRIERQQVLQERVSEQVPVEVARKRHLGGFTQTQIHGATSESIKQCVYTSRTS